MNVFRRLFTPKSESSPAGSDPFQPGAGTDQNKTSAPSPAKPVQSAPTPISADKGTDASAGTADPLIIQETGLPVIAMPELNITEPKGAEAFNFPQALSPTAPSLEPNLSLSTRQLTPQESTQIKPNAHLAYGFASDPGQVRMNNEDSIGALIFGGHSADQQPDLSLFVLADGMGGRDNGEQASAIAVRTLTQQVIKNLYLEMLAVTGDVRESSADRPPISEIMSSAVQSANMMVTQKVPDGGTTLTSVLIVGDMAYFGHVGDSRAYLITASSIEQLTRDHSLVQRLIELEQLTPEEAVTHSQRNVLYRALGQGASLEIDTSVRRLPASGYLLLCSDGLWNMVPQELIAQSVRNAPTLQEACNRLILAANQRGGADNISVILVQMPV